MSTNTGPETISADNPEALVRETEETTQPTTPTAPGELQSSNKKRNTIIASVAALGLATAGLVGWNLASGESDTPKAQPVATSTPTPQTSETSAAATTPATDPTTIPNIIVSPTTTPEASATAVADPTPQASYEPYSVAINTSPETLIDDKGTMSPHDVVHTWFANLQRTINLNDEAQQKQLVEILYGGKLAVADNASVPLITQYNKALRGTRKSWELTADGATEQKALDRYVYMVDVQVNQLSHVTKNGFDVKLTTSEGMATPASAPLGAPDAYKIAEHHADTSFVRQQVTMTINGKTSTHWVWVRGANRSSD